VRPVVVRPVVVEAVVVSPVVEAVVVSPVVESPVVVRAVVADEPLPEGTTDVPTAAPASASAVRPQAAISLIMSAPFIAATTVGVPLQGAGRRGFGLVKARVKRRFAPRDARYKGVVTRLLLIEDEESIATPLVGALEREGFEVEHAATGQAGLDAAARDPADLVLLDLMLPDMDGRDVCRALRSGSDVPVIMLTARGLETDRVVGLELGADDYVVKPFSVAELAARIRAVLRRGGDRAKPATEVLAVGDVELDRRTWTARKEGETLALARREFELLRLLLENAGEVVTRERLMREVWDTGWMGATKTLDVHVSTLRKKLGDDPGAPRYIHTVRGVGFRFAGPDELS
jgi:DNA-binding response OmpR family regulator